jgi:hypothetical protein
MDAPAFEPRGNAVSVTVSPRTLLVMPAFEPGWESFSVGATAVVAMCAARSFFFIVSFPALTIPAAVSLSPFRSLPWP